MTPVEQFRRFIVAPTLEHLGLHSQAAEDLVVGTAVHESGGLRYFEQITGRDDQRLGPALGYFQIEPATHTDLWENWLVSKPLLCDRLRDLLARWPAPTTQLVTNVAYSTAICRLIYYRRPEPLPEAGDLAGYAAYWKQHYNTALGAGTTAQFIHHYLEAH